MVYEYRHVSVAFCPYHVRRFKKFPPASLVLVTSGQTDRQTDRQRQASELGWLWSSCLSCRCFLQPRVVSTAGAPRRDRHPVLFVVTQLLTSDRGISVPMGYAPWDSHCL